MKNRMSRICIKEIIFFLVLGIYLSSCGNNDRLNDAKHQSQRDSLIAIVPAAGIFYKYSNDFKEITGALRNSPLINKKGELKALKMVDFPSELANKMSHVGITKLVYYTMYCDSLIGNDNNSLIAFDFTTNWGAAPPIHVSKESCVSGYNKLGDYLRQNNGNELWGLGDNWVIWYEHSPTSK